MMIQTYKPLIFLLFIVLISCNKKSEEKISKTVNEPEAKSESSVPLFSLLNSTETGIDFINYNKESNDYNYFAYEYFYNGGGVAVADFNNDNLLDIVFTANMALNKLYINKGDLKFEDISNTANINSNEQDWCTGVSIVDINNDGFQDIFVLRSGWFKNNNTTKLRNLLFVNNGDLTFTEKGLEYGFNDLSRSTQACFFDKDNDGDLDMYLINNPREFTKVRASKDSGKLSLVDVNNDYSDSDKLYENVNGTFKDITKASRLENCAFGLGVMASDINNDGWQDLYIANDYSKPDQVLINLKNGKFKDQSKITLKHMSKFSMGVDIADINNDGLQDIFTAEMLAKDNYSKKVNMASMNPKLYWAYVNNDLHYQDMHNSMQLNNGNGSFSEISWLSEIAETDWSWCPLFADFDNDGFKDLFVTNGVKRDVFNKDFSKDKKGKDVLKNPKIFESVKDFLPTTQVYNYVFKNNKDLTFSDKSLEWGLGTVMNSNGAAYGDLDNDGDLDLVISNIEAKAAIYRNNLNNSKNYISIKLLDGKVIPFGAKVSILDHDHFQYSELTNVHGFQSVSDHKLHFGLKDETQVDSVLITWPKGDKTLLTNLDINKTHIVDHKTSKTTNLITKKRKLLFKDVSKSINLSFNHKENEFDDYKREILIPHKQSQEGPFVDVADVNADGMDDFFIGNGVGYAGELFIQTKTGKFQKSNTNSFINDKMSEDLGVLFFDFDNDGDQDLYVVSGSNEQSLNAPEMQDRLYENDGKGNFIKTKNVIPIMESSGSCVVSNDFDQDGDLDLFIGGFQTPGKYPQAGLSTLLLNNNGVFENITTERAEGLERIGMVKDATFTDVNGDGKSDLVVVGHWMPISIFINENNIFVNKTKIYGLEDKVGWWNTILSDDFNKDGKEDFVVGNLGLNTKHKATLNQPFKIIAKDFDNNSTHDIALGYYNNYGLFPVRGMQCSSEQVPAIQEKVKSYDEFANLTFDEVYGNFNLSDAIKLDATYFESAIFINSNNSFEIQVLPSQSQFAPTNAIIALDINNNGLEELVTVGNMHPVEVETGRYDAHIGTVTEIDAQGNMRNVSYVQSGFFSDFDNRDIKKITINGKQHVMVSSNRGPIQFFEISQ